MLESGTKIGHGSWPYRFEIIFESGTKIGHGSWPYRFEIIFELGTKIGHGSSPYRFEISRSSHRQKHMRMCARVGMDGGVASLR